VYLLLGHLMISYEFRTNESRCNVTNEGRSLWYVNLWFPVVLLLESDFVLLRLLAWERGLIRHRIQSLVTTKLGRNSIRIVDKNHMICKCMVPSIEVLVAWPTIPFHMFNLVVSGVSIFGRLCLSHAKPTVYVLGTQHWRTAPISDQASLSFTCP
jgi:hypothetical protein